MSSINCFIFTTCDSVNNLKLNMKKRLIIICLLIFSTSCALFAQFVEYTPYQSQNIKNDWYSASVKYLNLKTNTQATYTLNVKVESNRVVIISFENNGSLHSGINNEGYSYYGGSLYFEMDSNNNVKAATTTVTILTSNGSNTTFKIRIE